MGKITIREASIHVVDTEIRSKTAADYFRDVPSAELELAFTRALEVGTFCLERSTTSQEIDFVKREIGAMVAAFEKSIGALPTQLENALLQKIGTGDGQVLAPMKTIIGETVKTTRDRVDDIRALVNDINPEKENSTTGKVIRSLRELLDPKRVDSVQGSIESREAAREALSRTTAWLRRCYVANLSTYFGKTRAPDRRTSQYS